MKLKHTDQPSNRPDQPTQPTDEHFAENLFSVLRYVVLIYGELISISFIFNIARELKNILLMVSCCLPCWTTEKNYFRISYCLLWINAVAAPWPEIWIVLIDVQSLRQSEIESSISCLSRQPVWVVIPFSLYLSLSLSRSLFLSVSLSLSLCLSLSLPLSIYLSIYLSLYLSTFNILTSVKAL